MHAHQTLSNREMTDDGEPNQIFLLGKKYAADALLTVRSGAVSPYFFSVLILMLYGMHDEALLHGFCVGLQEGA
jgi:hypothetical protein